ncbi:unnamed protein product [Discosporangium mesarthrocarpum]
MFRRWFRVPHPLFVHLAAEVDQQGWLGTSGANASGHVGIPVLCVLHILGKGIRPNDMFFFTGASESTAWSALHKFCECFCQHMW